MPTHFEIWQHPTHAVLFDLTSKFSLRELRKLYESYNEIQLLNKLATFGQHYDFAEVGCATGELYRYLRKCHPKINYFGFDISVPAILRARKKYPNGKFSVCKEDLSDLDKYRRSFAVLFARDVVVHQPLPFDFLSKLIAIPTVATIMRIRTRDHGKTELDPKLSCQKHYDGWVPYMILNINEVISVIMEARNIKSIHILKHYIQLGGHNNRFLPKSCYDIESGTAETSICIQFSKEKIKNPEIIIKEKIDKNPNYNFIDLGLRLLRRRSIKMSSACYLRSNPNNKTIL